MSERSATIDSMGRILRVGAAAVVMVVTVKLARFGGASLLFSVAYGAIIIIGLYLASRTPTAADKIADVGRGIVVAVVLALVGTAIAHGETERSARSSLAMTLSSGRNFDGIDLHGAQLDHFYIARKNLSNADLHGANLRGAVLQHTDLRNADLHGRRTDLSDADLSFADLSGAGTDLRLARLDNANLTEAKLRDARLAGARLRDANLSGADLRNADLREADLRGALLAGADLRGALLEADVRDAVFSADLREAKLSGAAMARARANGGTRWPEGFRLSAAIASSERPPKRAPPTPASAHPDSVVRVVDGDTIVLKELGHVRLLGINAPQEERPRECYATEATASVRRLLPAKTAVLYTLGSTRQDKFGRKLAYVWLATGRLVNEQIVAAGDATVLVPPHGRRGLPHVERSYVRRLRRAAVRAELRLRGLWKACPATHD